MGTVERKKHLQWEIPFTPRLKGGDNSEQEKCALKYIRGRQKKILKGKSYVNIYKILSSLDCISRERYIDVKST